MTDERRPATFPRGPRPGAGSALARERVVFQGCPRASAGSATAGAREDGPRVQRPRGIGPGERPIVIGRDHSTRLGRSPNRTRRRRCATDRTGGGLAHLERVLFAGRGRDLGLRPPRGGWAWATPSTAWWWWRRKRDGRGRAPATRPDHGSGHGRDAAARTRATSARRVARGRGVHATSWMRR